MPVVENITKVLLFFIATIFRWFKNTNNINDAPNIIRILFIDLKILFKEYPWTSLQKIM